MQQLRLIVSTVAAKRQVESLDKKLTAILMSPHLWISAVAAFDNCQFPGQIASYE
jgi:hypothetical protein